MISSPTNIKIIIASNHRIIISGIQAYISMCGFNATYLDFEDFDHVLRNQNKTDYFLIVHHRLLAIPKKQNLNQLIDGFKGRILILGSEKFDEDFHNYIILPAENDEQILGKLKAFFAPKISKIDSSRNDVLSSREIEILTEVALGYANKEIADRLFISINTVITHRKNITEKLGIKTISGLTVYALMNNLIHPNDVTI